MLSRFFIAPNVTYDGITTETRKEQARSGVDLIFYKIRKGKVIVRKGDEVHEDAFNLIKLINQSLEEKAGWLVNATGTFLLLEISGEVNAAIIHSLICNRYNFSIFPAE